MPTDDVLQSPAPAAITAPPAVPALPAAPVALALDPAPVVTAIAAGTPVPAKPDGVCAQAVNLARQAAIDVAGKGQVGDHVDLQAEGERVVTHYFTSTARGYRGWRWAVTVTRVPRARSATVSEVVLLPGPESVLAPTWLPWSDRIAPGDLGTADQLPYQADDPNLEPGYTAVDDEDADRLAIWELGLGRVRVLSPEGRLELAQRWYTSDRGPTSDEAVHAAAACSTCGYFLPLAGALRQVFGVCGNEWSPSDARVVSVDHGCGAHSETDIDRIEADPLPPPILDETGYEAVVRLPRTEPPAEPDDAAQPAVDEAPVDAAPPVDTVETPVDVETPVESADPPVEA